MKYCSKVRRTGAKRIALENAQFGFYNFYWVTRKYSINREHRLFECIKRTSHYCHCTELSLELYCKPVSSVIF